MRRVILILATAIIFVVPTCGFSSEQADELPKWLDLLQKGNAKEKKLALRNLWFLEYPENRKDPKVFDPIRNTLLKDKDQFVREAAAASLKIIGREIQKDIDSGVWSQNCCKNTAIVPSLIKALEDKSPSVRAEAAKALGMYRSDRKDRYTLDKEERAIEPLIKTLKDKDPWVRLNAVYSLGELNAKEAVAPLSELLIDDTDWRNNFVQQEIIIVLKKLPASNKKVISMLIQKYRNEYLKTEVINTIPFAIEAKELFIDAATEFQDSKIRKRALFALERIYVQLNGSDERITNACMQLLKDPSSDVRMIAARILGESKDRPAIKPLLKIAAEKKVRPLQILPALKEYNDPRMVDTLIAYLQGEDKDVEKGAILVLGEFGTDAEKAIEPLKKLLNDPDPQIKTDAKDAIGKVESAIAYKKQRPVNQAGSDILIPPLGGRPEFPRSMGGPSREKEYSGLSEQKKEEEAIPRPPPSKPIDIKPLITKLKDKNPKIRREAADALGDNGDKKAVPYLIPLLKDSNEYVRQVAARALGKLKSKESVEPLIAALKDPDANVLAFTIWALGEIKDPRAAEPLAPLLLSKEEKTRESAFEAMRKFTDPVSRRLMVNTLMKAREQWMLQRLISLEGEDVVLKTFEDSGGDKIKTIRNYINLMASGNNAASGIASKALKNEKDRKLVITEMRSRIASGDKDASICISFLGNLNDRSALPILIEALKKSKGMDRYGAIEAIGKLEGYKEIESILMEILIDANEGGVRAHAARALGKLGDKKAVGALIKIAQDDKEIRDIKIGIIAALGDIKDKRAIEPLTEIIKNTQNDVWLRVAAVSSLGDIGDEGSISVIQEAASNDSTGYIKNAAQGALNKIKTGN